LYNLIAIDREKAAVVVAAIQQVFKGVKLYVPYLSKIEEVAVEKGIEVVYEAFADRAYNDNLTLVSRELPSALITDKHKVLKQVQQLVEEQLVTTVQCHKKVLKAATFCMHGDTKNVVEILEYLHQKLVIS